MKKGFTLFELVLLVACISAIASITWPTITKTLGEAHQNQCRSNMMTLATGEAMYYGTYNEYGSLENLVATGIMENALDLECPTLPNGIYEYSSTGCEQYIIACPNLPGTGIFEHGFVDTGISSWQ